MQISVAEKLRIIMGRLNVTMTDLADRSGQSRQNLSNKFSRGNFTEEDIEKLGKALNCDVTIVFTLPDGTKI